MPSPASWQAQGEATAGTVAGMNPWFDRLARGYGFLRGALLAFPAALGALDVWAGLYLRRVARLTVPR